MHMLINQELNGIVNSSSCSLVEEWHKLEEAITKQRKMPLPKSLSIVMASLANCRCVLIVLSDEIYLV